MRLLLRIIKALLVLGFAGLMLGVLAATGVYAYYAPHLPSIEVLRDVRLQVPLKVYTRDGELMAEFGEKRRTPLAYEQMPPRLIQAFLSAEDDRFFEHPGVDYQGMLRAVSQLLLTGEKKQGGSTITMQVARNFFLSNEKTYERKIKEIMLAFKIERSLTKEEILALYLNKIYLGNRSYGVGAAGEVYYGAKLQDLNLAQLAMIAGLPKAPSRYNPLANPDRAIERRNYVLRRMRELSYISQAEHDEAVQQPVSAYLRLSVVTARAPYVAEMVRKDMLAHFGEDAYTGGYKVYTTIDRQAQQLADAALRKALNDYDQRHGYRGAEGKVEDIDQLTSDLLADRLSTYPGIATLTAAVVIQVEEKEIRAFIGEGQTVQIGWEGLKWARAYKDENKRGPEPAGAADIVSVGDVVRLIKDKDDKWRLAQVPEVAGAFIALNPADGAILGLVGGYDFYHSKYNRAIQSRRQPGSGFKPVLYATALEEGFTPSTTVNDAPIVLEDSSVEGGAWRPQNYSSKFFGPTRLRVALYKSRNLVSVRLIDAVGVAPVRQMAMRMGFTGEEIPNNMTISLGSASLAPMRMATAYSVFANGGFRIQPYLIQAVDDIEGRRLLTADPLVVCQRCRQPLSQAAEADHALLLPLSSYLAGEQSLLPAGKSAPRVISPQVHFQMTSMLKDVVKRGTARRALALKRGDIAGKTGTTNDQYDAWFNGFSPDLVAVAWVGFDRFAPLGRKETGGRAALPMWIDFMGQALAGRPERGLAQPDGMVTVKIDPKTGLQLPPGQAGGIFETFRKEHLPAVQQLAVEPVNPEEGSVSGSSTAGDMRENLF